jgi:hypothetical protein
LAEFPAITVPTITKAMPTGTAPRPERLREEFSGRYERRLVTGGIGHNLPQEAPQAFA